MVFHFVILLVGMMTFERFDIFNYFLTQIVALYMIFLYFPVVNVTGISSCIFEGSLVGNETKSAREIPLFS